MSGGWWNIIYSKILFYSVMWLEFQCLYSFLTKSFPYFYDFCEWDTNVQNAGDSILISWVSFTTSMKNILNVELLYPMFYFVYFWKKPQLYIYSLHLSTNKTEVLVCLRVKLNLGIPFYAHNLRLVSNQRWF